MGFGVGWTGSDTAQHASHYFLHATIKIQKCTHMHRDSIGFVIPTKALQRSQHKPPEAAETPYICGGGGRAKARSNWKGGGVWIGRIRDGM